MERVPCPPDICGTERCPVFVTEGHCYEDIHHKQWPRRVIRKMGTLAMAWREMDVNKERRCRASHNELHATTPPPLLPSRSEIVAFMRGPGDEVA